MKVYHQPVVRQTRRALRRANPEPENRLWYYLRDRRLSGLKFRRQFSVGRYIIDFYCAKPRVAIEIDGDSHFTAEAQKYDLEREKYIRACGITILRFTNDEVQRNIEGVLEKILAVISSPAS